MHIVIAGGYEQTDFLIENLKENGHRLTVINENRGYCEKLSAHHGLPVFHGDPTRFYVLNDAEIDGADVLVALSEHDENNLTVCSRRSVSTSPTRSARSGTRRMSGSSRNWASTTS